MTPKQRKLLDYISTFIKQNRGVSPSYEQMMHHMGLASKSGVHRMVLALEEQKEIIRWPHRSRSILLPDMAKHHTPYPAERSALLQLRPLIKAMHDNTVSKKRGAQQALAIIDRGISA